VPAGLDGNPEPIATPARDAVLDEVVAHVLAFERPRVLVGIDGASGTGKSTFADELAARLATRGRTVVRSTTDSFHRPRAERLRRGPTSPDGFYLDSHQLGRITGEVLEPFARGEPRVRTAAFDEPSDRAVDAFADDLPGEAVLVFDGLFLLRSELRSHWDLVVHLLAESRRLQDRERWPRYVDGYQRYLDDADPLARADLVVDNDDLAAPSYHRRMAATYGVFCPDCNEVFGQYESLDDAKVVAELHCETSGHDCRTDPIQTTGDPGSLPE